jgi:hypothetical protein
MLRYVFMGVLLIHFYKVTCEATSTLHVVLKWLRFKFVESFFGPTPKLFIFKWLPHYCEGEIFSDE